MNQVLHIFRKDTRRFWIEILLSIVVLAIYVERYSTQWQGPMLLGARGFMVIVQGLQNLTIFLIPVVWWLLIARMIQAESLAGDRQWWVTRPYQRKKLLMAKVLFLAIWIYVPFVLAQMAILRKAGLPPLGHAGHWFFLLLFVSGFVIMPLVAIAAVTSNFARMALAVLGACVTVIVFFSVASTYAPAYWPEVAYTHYIYILAVIGLGTVTVVGLQYAMRSVWLGRALLVVVALLAAGVGLARTAMLQGEVDREFPATIGTTTIGPVQVAFRPSDSNRLLIYSAQRTGMVYIQLPLEFSGVSHGAAVEIEDEKFTMDSANGQQWTSPWRLAGDLRYLSGTYNPGVPIMMSREQYEHFKSQPMTLHLTLAVTELRAAGDNSAVFSEDDFKVDGYGVCARIGWLNVNRGLICRSEVGPSPLTYITTTFSQYPCSGSQPAQSDVIDGFFWTGKAYSDPLDSIWTPVVLNQILPEAHHSNGRLAGTHDLTLCPGTPAHFTQYTATRRTQVSLTIPNFQLPAERH